MSNLEEQNSQNKWQEIANKSIQQAANQNQILLGVANRHSKEILIKHWSALRENLNDISSTSTSLFNSEAGENFKEYIEDYFQRLPLFLDTLRQRGNAYVQQEAGEFKPVLFFDYDIIIDGRTLKRPVNYTLVRIKPPENYPQQREDGRPFVIIDPRAGHGSGIGGFKAQSEVGVALQDGHPVYFVIFYPKPEPNQTLADICHTEAKFLEEIRKRHPEAPAPLVIGNCQGGWASMILSATYPDLTGPVVIAGAPLSYWAGEIGKNPLRYFGGLAGGAVPALLASDLGGGKFDGASLVLNFEQLNPGKTWWRKYYDVFASDQKTAEEFLRFEKWWSGFYFMNTEEIRWIVENLFIGNKLTRGKAILNDGTPVDLTRIKAPVIVFASHGDNITPPQQALNWIADLHESVDEIKARGHVIIYTLHDSIGHLGIFVSASVASKQHKQITSVVKTIEALAPGLYEMLIREDNGAFEVSFDTRTIDDILSLDDGREEEEEFAAVAKISEWATKTYELTMRPTIKAMVTPALSEIVTNMHPIRQYRYIFSDKNPMMSGVESWAKEARKSRHGVLQDNPFIQLEKIQANLIEQSWNFYRDTRDAMLEFAFHGIYASPWMKAIGEGEMPKPISYNLMQFPEVQAALKKVSQGSFKEAMIRMLILVAKARGSVRRDRLERSDKMLHSQPPFNTMSEDNRTQIIKEQNMIVQFAPNEAILSLPALLQDDADRLRAVNLMLDIAGPEDEMDAATISMFKRIQEVLDTVADN